MELKEHEMTFTGPQKAGKVIQGERNCTLESIRYCEVACNVDVLCCQVLGQCLSFTENESRKNPSHARNVTVHIVCLQLLCHESESQNTVPL